MHTIAKFVFYFPRGQKMVLFIEGVAQLFCENVFVRRRPIDVVPLQRADARTLRGGVAEKGARGLAQAGRMPSLWHKSGTGDW